MRILFIWVDCGVISQDVSCDKDIERRTGLAAGIVRNLHKVWKSKEMSKTSRVLLYRTLVQSFLLYNSERKNTRGS